MNRYYYPYLVALGLAIAGPSHARISEYTLVIDRQPVHITGRPLERITINGSIPGPPLLFTQGDEALIHVTNKMDEDSSVHWHGLLLPGEMDGVPGLNGFHGIAPNETFTYRFTLRQAGTYWYHAHSTGQEQDGHYGPIIVSPKGHDPIRADREHIVLLSDFHRHRATTILANLKKSSDYYTYTRRTVGDFLSDMRQKGFRAAWRTARMWGQMRMLSTDLTDVGDYTFLINGKTPEQNWTGLYREGEQIRLRFINASAMSFYDVRIPGLKMTVVAADGQNIEPVEIDEFRFGVAETYDVLVAPTEDRAYTIVAEPLDRTGFATGTLAPRAGMQGPPPRRRSRALLTMADMGMSDHHHNHTQAADSDYRTGVPGSGWAEAGTPEGDKALSYADLRYHDVQPDTRPPEREIIVRLGGNMERYIWTLNGRKHPDAEPIELEYGERVRLTFINTTMMAHPMHLHGMFVQLENSQAAEKLPNKHTIIVAPGDTYSALLTASEPGEWAFHCHLLYHMMAGMMNKVVVAKLDASAAPAP